jgi:hypothetical protein
VDGINLDEEIIRDLRSLPEEGGEEEEEEEEEGFLKAKANEVDAGRDPATPASVRHADDEPSFKRNLEKDLLRSKKETYYDLL